jgi:hypothetical protein
VEKLWPVGATGAVCLLLMAGCGGSSHTRSAGAKLPDPATSYADYPVLLAGEPSHIDVVSLANAHRMIKSRARPIWVAVSPKAAGATLPEIETAREIVHKGLLRAWAAKSDRGGLCVLLFDPALSPRPATAHSVTASCGVAGELGRGIALVQHLGSVRTGTSLLLGLVPRGVTQISLDFGDGSTSVLPVTDNSYSVTVKRRIASVSFVRDGVRQQTIP